MLVWILICTACLIACASVHSEGLKNLSDGTNNMMNILESECQLMVGKTNALIKTMDDLNENPERDAMKKATTRVCDAVAVSQNNLRSNYDTMKNVSIAYWCFMCATPLLGILSWALGRGQIAYGLIVMSWTLMILTFIHFAIAYSGGTWIDDTCVQMQHWYDCKSPAHAFDVANGLPMDAKCKADQLTLATSGALSNGDDLCPDFHAITPAPSPSSYTSGYSSESSPSNAHLPSDSYWQLVYTEQWINLKKTVESYNKFWDGPAFGVTFSIPGSPEPPIRCGDNNPGASCVLMNQSHAFQNVTALRKLYYDSEGGHYDSDVKACSTLFNTSSATLGTIDEHDWDTYDVKDPSTYDASCISEGWCNNTDLFALPLVKVEGGVEKPQLTQKCHEKAILTAADGMWKASYMSSCAYVLDTAEHVIVNDGPCDSVGDGFLFVFGSLCIAGVLYLAILIVAYAAMHAWDKNNYEETRQHFNKKMGHFEGTDSVQKVHIEVDDTTEDKKDFEDIH